MAKEQTHFGFKQVEEGQKESLVGEVFSSVASQYDLMNDLMSAGLHRIWKERLVDLIKPHDGMKLLDVASGTGDISVRVIEKAKAAEKNIAVTVCDINKAMLAQGRLRAIDCNMLDCITFKQGNAESLPFKDKTFDYYTIAFGIRNVTHIQTALAEAYRVLKPGGQFICLEFSHVDNKMLSEWYDRYSFEIIPRLGKYVTGDSDAYQYLVESIRQFPRRDMFTAMIEKTGFEQVRVAVLTGGVVAIHSGWRI